MVKNLKRIWFATNWIELVEDELGLGNWYS